mmetsp:Transcript_14736/g.29064  ORF Transcript_14736/g.29064 Transcript_14736/m.29064 type:complete len:375 (-) Transcript_14736:56-1180(-)
MAPAAEDSGGNARPAEAVARVLKAADHYEAIGAIPSASAAEIRGCYLRTAVRVHPDKNDHPDATKAFQRVAAAWAVLGDEGARQRYDAERESGAAPDNSGPKRCGQTNSVSSEEAFAAFAFVVAACSQTPHSMVGELGEVLFCAEQLARMRQTGEGPDARALLGGGFALASGLRAFGAAADAAGLENVGAAAERAAGVLRCASQVAAVGVAAAQIPAVQEALEGGKSAAAERAQQLGSAVDGARGVVREGAAGAAVQLGSALTSVGAWAQRARQAVAEAVSTDETCEEAGAGAGASESLEDAPTSLPEGTLVRLTGLQGAAHLNGQVGEVLGIDAETLRYRVLLQAQTDVDNEKGTEACDIKRVKLENLELLPK